MSIELKFAGTEISEVNKQILAYAALLGSTSAAAVTAAASGKAESVGTAAPKASTASPASGSKKDTKLQTAVGSKAKVVEPEPEAEEPEDDPLAEDGDDETPELTKDFLTELLVQVRDLYPEDKKIVGNTVLKFGGAQKLKDVDESKFADIYAEVKRLLAEKGA